ncbi:MAG TPA: sulfotransferase [Luteibacter sp.]|nr:sulfotransferase [Luteibacter sp.]
MRRTFVVGCPRSGTTIVQALLARHPAIYTLPETAFFEDLHGELAYRWGDHFARPQRQRLRHRLGFARKAMREKFVALQHKLAVDAAAARRPPLRSHAMAEGFIDMLDGLAAEAGRSMWIEKTPNHLLYIPEIEALVPDARFVHVIRPGADVLASLVDAYLRFENDLAFGGGTVHWARRWNHAMRLHGAHVGQARHHFIFLEDLIHHQDTEWKRLCAFLDVPAHVSLEEACNQTIANLEQEPWKQGAVSGLVLESDRKVEALFGPTMRQWLQTHLVPYEDLRARCQKTYRVTHDKAMPDGVPAIPGLHRSRPQRPT